MFNREKIQRLEMDVKDWKYKYTNLKEMYESEKKLADNIKLRRKVGKMIKKSCPGMELHRRDGVDKTKPRTERLCELYVLRHKDTKKEVVAFTHLLGMEAFLAGRASDFTKKAKGKKK